MAKSLLLQRCDCAPKDRLTGEQAGAVLGMQPDEVYRLVYLKVVWVASTEKDGSHRFCKEAISAMAADPKILASYRKLLERDKRK